MRREKLWRKSKHIQTSTNFFFFFFFENRSFEEIMWKNIARPDSQQVTIWRMRVACWLPEATNTFSEYVIRIAFPLQELLYERA
jgi:hypothetical protein